MKGLPEDVNLAPLIGSTVEQIRFSKWSIQLMLDGDNRIVIQSVVGMSDASKNFETDDYLAHATEICSIFGSKILSAERTKDGGMELRMSSGLNVCIRNSEPHYESFQVHFGESVLVG
jgi:hypothetical protein